jgi:hypothetical protein
VVKKYPLTHGEFCVQYGGMDGVCIMPDRLMPPGTPEEFTIWIDARLRGLKRLDTLIHETVHAERPDLSEDEVLTLASNIAKVLWGEGYRGEK